MFSVILQLLALWALVFEVQAQYYAPPPSSSSQYSLTTTYDQSNFFTEFKFFTDKDPTNGFVEYVDGPTATQAGLAGIKDGAIHMRADAETQNPTNGRRSVRLTSTQAFNHGLFIADIAHMPGNACGVWPAFWMFGAPWPDRGEIDIIEGVSYQQGNQVTLHSNPGCTITSNGTATTTEHRNPDCNALINNNVGCAQKSSDALGYGDPFNAIGGGVYAMEWTSSHIAVWFFPRYAIPADIASGNPRPGSRAWGLPMAVFNTNAGCNLDQYFVNNNLVFDITFCGDWAGAVWGDDPVCGGSGRGTCQQYVAGNPDAFRDAYWLVNSIKVYTQRAGYYARRHRHRSHKG